MSEAHPDTLPDPEPVLRVRRVNHFFGDGEGRKQVLFDNNLEIAPGEIVIMTGPSGSGKTTLLTLIGGLRTLQDGSIRVRDRELSGLSADDLVAVRRGIGFIFQAHNLFTALTAFQNVRMAMELVTLDAAVMEQRITNMLTQLGLEHRIHYKPESLSGGQRQRVAIARALINRPKLILADEPTAALDEKSGRDVVNLLQRMAVEEGVTSIIVTHDNRILDVADRIVNMVDGRIVRNTLVKQSVQLCEFLVKCPPFAELTPQDLANVADQMIRARYPAGAVIIRQGDIGETFFVIRRGTVDVIIDQGTADEKHVAVLGEGEFFGERALITGEPRNATVIAREKVEVFTMSKDDFQRALETSPSFHDQLYHVYFARQ